MNATVEVLQAPSPEIAAASHRGTVVRVLRVTGALALAAGLLGYVFPHVAGTTVSDVRAAFSAVSGRDAAILTVLWAAGLFTHSFVLTGALPGLTRSRALTLNLTGSAVANTLPFGGAAGMSMNYVMIRAWGVESAGFAAFTLVTNLWVVLMKLAMPVLALAALWATGGPVSLTTRWTAVVSVSALVLVLLAVAGALASRRGAARALALVSPAVVAIGRLVRRQVDPVRLEEGVLAARDAMAAVLRRRWGQMSFGMVGYGLLQALLLWASLHAVGADLPPAVVLAGFAVDRVMTLAVITPGAIGFAEAGTAAALVALGGSPGAVAAAVLLYRGFTFALEIPVGGTWLAAWLLRRRWLARSEPAAPAAVEPAA
ncbi:MAG TPA: lysylphosphatidylglycerol synthase domain-containing protein [Marmoricola sp.]|nr:lysylphosphatidylglycerol synthase domain-containing protein [Marmoricola sp.]